MVWLLFRSTVAGTNGCMYGTNTGWAARCTSSSRYKKYKYYSVQYNNLTVSWQQDGARKRQ